jgi:transcriptional regulator with XRE-family HTH domain
MDFSLRLTLARKKLGISKNRLAKLTGLSQPYITELESGRKKPALATVEKLCSALGLSLAEFFAENDQEPDIPSDLRHMLNVARRLTPRQRKLLLEIMEEWANYNETKGEIK